MLTLFNKQKRLILILILLVIFCPIGIDIYLPAFLAMEQSLAVNESQIKHTITVYMIAVGLVQLFAGPLADKYGRRPIALVGIALFFLGSVIALLSPTWQYIMFARILQGLGSCATFVLAFTIVRDHFGNQGSSQAITYLNGIVCFIPASAPILGAWLTIHFGWKSNFAFLSLFSLCSFYIVYNFFQESKSNTTFFTGHIYDLRRFLPMLKNPTFMFNACITMIAMTAILIFVTSSPGWLLKSLNLSIHDFTTYFTTNAIISIFASFVAPRFIGRMSRKCLTVGLFMMLLSALLLIFLDNINCAICFMGPMYLASVGFAFTMGSAAGKALERFPNQAGTASALIGVMQMSGASLLAFLIMKTPFSTPLQLAFALLLVLPFLGLICTKHKYKLHPSKS